MDGDLMEAMRRGGEAIRVRAAANAAAWSRKIPPSGRVVSIWDDRVQVVFGSNEAPNAYPFELGIRHPLWARGPRDTWDWGPTPHRPFLAPAAVTGLDPAAREIIKVVDKWANELPYLNVD